MDFILSISQGNHGTRWETLGRIGTGRSRLTDENFGTVWDTSTFFLGRIRFRFDEKRTLSSAEALNCRWPISVKVKPQSSRLDLSGL